MPNRVNANNTHRKDVYKRQYSGKPIALALPENCKNQICEKGYRNSPLTSEQKMNNRRKSRIRCRIERIFGFMTGAMHGITVRSIGITRAWMNIGITNLVYNFCRYSYCLLYTSRRIFLI